MGNENHLGIFTYGTPIFDETDANANELKKFAQLFCERIQTGFFRDRPESHGLMEELRSSIENAICAYQKGQLSTGAITVLVELNRRIESLSQSHSSSQFFTSGPVDSQKSSCYTHNI